MARTCKQAWFYHPTGSVTVLRIQGKTVTPIKTIEVGALPEAIAFSPDGRYIYVGNYTDEDFSILKVNGTDVTNTGKRFKVAAILRRCTSGRDRPQFPTDCTCEKLTDSAPSSNCMPVDWLCTPVAVPITLVGSVVVLPSEFAAVTTTL